jgi:hypothetical protein
MPNPWKLTSFVLGALLAASLSTGALNTADAGPQPNMRNALGSLKTALASLNAATADKGGHRVKAIDLTKSAIEQVEQGIKFDNKH